MPPPAGQSGFSGYSGFSGKAGTGAGTSGFSGYSGVSGFSGAAGTSPSLPTGDISITGSLTTGSAGGQTGDIALSGAISGTAHLRAEAIAGAGIFTLPNATGVHTLATVADIEALRQELILLGILNG